MFIMIYYLIDGGPDSPPSVPPGVPPKAPDDPNLSSDPLDVAAVTAAASPPFSLSFRLDDDLRTNLRSFSLSERRRLSRTFEAPLALLLVLAEPVVGVVPAHVAAIMGTSVLKI